jgi:hypothetical protein
MPKVSKDTASETVAIDGFAGHFEKLEGGYTVGFETYLEDSDPADLFKGLPDDRCQSAHWGYVLKGKVAYRYGDREEHYEAGDAYYAPPGHTPLFYADTEVVEFSPTESFDETTRVVTDNLRAAGVEAR